MYESDQTYSSYSHGPWHHKVAKNILFKLFDHLPTGHLVILENDHLIARFGDKNSSLQGKINIKHPKAYNKLLFGGSIGAGEAYVEGLWDSPDLTKVIQIFARNLSTLDAIEQRFSWLVSPIRKLSHWKNRNTTKNSKRNISSHYDLGNRLYTRFLDNSMMYSSAIYPNKNSPLSEAQTHKLATICDKLQLTKDDHLLEIGTGWGGLAIFAAQHYGCKVTTTTISEEQHDFAQQKIEALGLSHQITLLKQDYRLLEGKYDKLVSIEMIEAVGKEYLDTFFEKCNSLLKETGVMVLQSITINDQRYDSYAKNVDFIQKHIFPGGFLPSQLVISDLVKRYTNMMVRDLHDIGLHYAQTLRDWHHNLIEHKDALNQDGYDERFIRLWRYYFCYCEGGFIERAISTVQLVITKPDFQDHVYR